MSLDEKINDSLDLIRKIDAEYKKPLILCSFGKDSMALLHLIKSLNLKWNVGFHRFHIPNEKYEFADTIIEEWGLKIYEPPISERSIVTGNGMVDIAAYVSTGSDGYNVLMPNLVESSDHPDHCGKDLLELDINTSNTSFPYDICVTGTKAADVDPVLGNISCPEDIICNKDSADFAHPLRRWSEEDIFSYITKNNVPFQGTRYLWGNGKFVQNVDTSKNPDYLDCCTRCINPENGKQVRCPKTNKMILNHYHGERQHKARNGDIYLA